MARRASDAFAAKQRRQKMIAIGGGVMLLGLVAVQGPKLWKQMHPSTPAAAPSVAAPTGAATPTPAAGAVAAVPAPTLVAARTPKPATIAGALIPGQPQFAPGAGQLRSFSTFTSKDPFKQQVSAETADAAAAAPSAPAASTPATAPPTAQAAPPPAAAQPHPSAAPSAHPAKQPKKRPAGHVAPAALIVVNGTGQVVNVHDAFPKRSPVFRLVSLKDGVARIAVVGGSYASGNPTIELRVGKKLTLLNTSTGTRYVLRLTTTKAGGATGFSLGRTPAN